jgi:hypothetical protein
MVIDEAAREDKIARGRGERRRKREKGDRPLLCFG